MANSTNYSSDFEEDTSVHHILRSILLSFVFVFGTVGNILLFAVILRKGRITNVTNLFNLNLAVGDFIRIFVFIPVYLLYSAQNEWPPGLGYAGCKTVFMVVQSSLTVSMVTLMFMSIERHQAVVKPLKKQVTTQNKSYEFRQLLSIQQRFSELYVDFWTLTHNLNLMHHPSRVVDVKLGTITECRATSDHLFYMRQNLLKNEV